ncbi:MAG: S8 family serine peptidase [Shewanella sp.]
MGAIETSLTAMLTLALVSGVNAAEQERYIVKFKEGKGPSVMGQLKAQGGKLALELANHDAAALKGLANNPNVEYVATSTPLVGVSDTAGQAMLGQLGTLANVSIGAGNYAYFDVTSMATPHVAGVAALV